jgi:hypothetical protein
MEQDNDFLYSLGKVVKMPTIPASGWMNQAQKGRGDSGGLAYVKRAAVNKKADRLAWQIQPPLMNNVVPNTYAKTVYGSEAKILSSHITDGGLRIENNYVLPQNGMGVGGSNAIQDNYTAPNALSMYDFTWSPSTQTSHLGKYFANEN